HMDLGIFLQELRCYVTGGIGQDSCPLFVHESLLNKCGFKNYLYSAYYLWAFPSIIGLFSHGGGKRCYNKPLVPRFKEPP
ncbi:MAG: hypothetical protein ACSW8K_12375, partial [bacterium]